MAKVHSRLAELKWVGAPEKQARGPNRPIRHVRPAQLLWLPTSTQHWPYLDLPTYEAIMYVDREQQRAGYQAVIPSNPHAIRDF